MGQSVTGEQLEERGASLQEREWSRSRESWVFREGDEIEPENGPNRQSKMKIKQPERYKIFVMNCPFRHKCPRATNSRWTSPTAKQCKYCPDWARNKRDMNEHVKRRHSDILERRREDHELREKIEEKERLDLTSDTTWFLQLSPGWHIRFKSDLPSACPEYSCSSCRTKTSVLQHHTCPFRFALASGLPQN